MDNLTLFDMPREWTHFDDFYCKSVRHEADAVDRRVIEARNEGREDFAQSLEDWASTLRSWAHNRELLKPDTPDA